MMNTGMSGNVAAPSGLGFNRTPSGGPQVPMTSF